MARYAYHPRFQPFSSQSIVPLSRLNLITGPNGSGKSSVYRALRLLAETAQGGVIPSLAREGGLPSTLWAGPETLGRSVKRGDHQIQGTVKKERANLRLGFAGDEFGYAIDLGLPPPVRPPATTAFALDPEIKTETIWAGPILRPAASWLGTPHWCVQKTPRQWQCSVTNWQFRQHADAMAVPRNAPMLFLREQIRSWRFYDPRATLKHPHDFLKSAHTHRLAGSDGSDMAAAGRSGDRR